MSGLLDSSIDRELLKLSARDILLNFCSFVTSVEHFRISWLIFSFSRWNSIGRLSLSFVKYAGKTMLVLLARETFVTMRLGIYDPSRLVLFSF